MNIDKPNKQQTEYAASVVRRALTIVNEPARTFKDFLALLDADPDTDIQNKDREQMYRDYLAILDDPVAISQLRVLAIMASIIEEDSK